MSQVKSEKSKETQKLLWCVSAGAAVVVVALIVYFVITGYYSSMEWGIDSQGLAMEGAYGESGVPEDYSSQPSQPQAPGVQQSPSPNRENGYGTAYHIVGEKMYPCSNDPNSLGTYPCGVDDFSVWQDGTKKDFDVNPTYGAQSSDGARHFPDSQNPYNYNGCGNCRCSINRNPRQTFDVDDNFIHHGRRYKDCNVRTKLGDHYSQSQ